MAHFGHAEDTNRSHAVKPSNRYSVAQVLLHGVGVERETEELEAAAGCYFQESKRSCRQREPG